MDKPFSMEAMSGEWKARVYLRLKGINQIFLNKPQNDPNYAEMAEPYGCDSDSSEGSFKQVEGKGVTNYKMDTL